MNVWVFLQGLNWNYQTIAATSSVFAYSGIITMVLAKARKHPATRLFILANVAVVFWITEFCVASMVVNKEDALLWTKIFTIGAIFTGPLYVHLAWKITGFSLKRSWLVSYYIFSVFLVFVNFFTSFFIKDLVPYKYPFSIWFINPGPLYGVFALVFGAFAVYLLYQLYQKQKAEVLKKKQIRLLMWGYSFAVIGGLCYILSIFDLLIPFPHDYLTILLPVATMYSIIRYRLMEIDTVIHRTILWALVSMGLIIPIYFIVSALRAWLTRLTDLWLALVEMILFYIFLWYYHYSQPRIDHIFRRRKYDYYQVLGEIGQKIGSELNIASVSSRLFGELKEVLYIRNGFLLVQEKSEADYSESEAIGYEGILGSVKREKLALSPQTATMSWFAAHQAVLERERVAEDPQYGEIRSEILELMEKEQVEILIPVIADNRVNALIGIGKKENLQLYTARDIELLDKMGKQIGVTIENALHHEDIVEKERMAEELKLGREIQTALLPKGSPLIEGLVVSGEMLPAKEIGGDYYDYIVMRSAFVRDALAEGKGNLVNGACAQRTTQDARLAIVIGDVSGKGVAAGLLMAMAKTAIHTLSHGSSSPREILLHTNQILHEHLGGQKFMTMLYLLWDARQRKVTYSSAGHEHIIIYRASDKLLPNLKSQISDKDQAGTRQVHDVVEVILSGGFMLGMLPEIGEFLEEKDIELNRGDKIVLYTDGVTEARNEQEAMFGLERLVEVVKKHGAKPVEELKRAITEDVHIFIGKQEQYDDITLVVMEAM